MKKIHRFLISEAPKTSSFVLEDKEVVHLINNVLKLKKGEECIFFVDGSDDYLCSISEINKKSISLKIEKQIPNKSPKKIVTACISIVKKDNFELIVQKLTELGVSFIVPIISDRTIKQSLRIDRLQKISDEALEQSGRSKRVLINDPLSLKNALEKFKNSKQYYFDIGGEKIKEQNFDDIVFYVGPEGGWSEEESKLFEQHNIKKYKLGDTILRAETAAIVGAYNLLWI
jgi:16S rRNA (uracil1498-N3)-methyltransferase